MFPNEASYIKIPTSNNRNCLYTAVHVGTIIYPYNILQGRPYLDKMKWDRTEMLYWLQEERKQHALDVQNSLAIKKQNLHMTPIAQN